MDWQSALQGANLIWTTLGVALTGLTAALVAGWTVRGIIDKRTLQALKDQIAGLARDLADKDAIIIAQTDKIALLEAKLTALTSPQSPASASPAEPIRPIGERWWLRPLNNEDRQLLDDRNHQPPILVVANLKGGVAKTMLSANLAAYHARLGKRVLLIDMDYQGSLSEMTLTAMAHPPSAPNLDARVETLLSTDLFDDSLAFNNRVPPGPGTPNISLYPSEYGFDDYEFRAVGDWQAGRVRDDIRLRLLRRLNSKPFRDSFDLVIIDTGPRLSFGAVAALVAGTHLLVPSAPDRRSIEAADRFIRRVGAMRDSGVTAIKGCGVIATLVTDWHYGNGAMTYMRENLQQSLGGKPEFEWVHGGEPKIGHKVVLETTLKYTTTVQRAAIATIPFLANGENAIRNMISKIGEELEGRMQ